jgi:hypothetical protein
MNELTNWLGQELRVGDWVYRGARRGNFSSFKIGIITKIDNTIVTVNWRAEPGGGGGWKPLDSTSRSDYNTLVRLDDFPLRSHLTSSL